MIHGAGKTKIPGASPTNRYQIVVHMPDDVEGGESRDLLTDARGTLSADARGTLAPVPPNTSDIHVNDTSITRWRSRI